MLGRLYEDAGRIGEATAAYAEAVRQGRAQAETYLQLAKLYGQQRRYERVVDTARALLARDPDQVEAHRLLAFVLRHQGREDEAVVHVRSYLALAPEGESAADLARWLRDRGDGP